MVFYVEQPNIVEVYLITSLYLALYSTCWLDARLINIFAHLKFVCGKSMIFMQSDLTLQKYIGRLQYHKWLWETLGMAQKVPKPLYCAFKFHMYLCVKFECAFRIIFYVEGVWYCKCTTVNPVLSYWVVSGIFLNIKTRYFLFFYKVQSCHKVIILCTQVIILCTRTHCTTCRMLLVLTYCNEFYLRRHFA